MARPIVGVILAGGLGRRMGSEDKPLLQLGGSPLLSRVVDRIRPQVEALAISANGNPDRFASFGLPVFADLQPGHLGPLAGILAGMDWAQRHSPETVDIVTVPADTPFLPGDLVERLRVARRQADGDLACAASAGRVHPVIGLWPVKLCVLLREALENGQVRKVSDWTASLRTAIAEFPASPLDPFFNVNTPGDLAMAAQLAARV